MSSIELNAGRGLQYTTLRNAASVSVPSSNSREPAGPARLLSRLLAWTESVPWNHLEAARRRDEFTWKFVPSREMMVRFAFGSLNRGCMAVLEVWDLPEDTAIASFEEGDMVYCTCEVQDDEFRGSGLEEA